MSESHEAAAALAEILRIDPTFAAEPDRLSRALADLLPDQDRSARLLVAGAVAGVPAMLTAGNTTQARTAMRDTGLRDDVADWVVTQWLMSFPDGSEPTSGWAPMARPLKPSPGTFEDDPTEMPGPATVVRLGVWPDGIATVGVVTGSGIYATVVGFEPADARLPELWRRIATPQASASRDVAITARADGGVAIWSDTTGLHARGLLRDDAPAGSAGLLLDEPRSLLASNRADQPRYPLSAVAMERDSVDVVWTADRRTLRRGLFRPGLLPTGIMDLPVACEPGERIAGLDLARAGDRTVWLVVLTDRGRVLVSYWNVTVDDVASWVPCPPPVDVTAVAVTNLSAGPTIFATTSDGHILSVDASAAFADAGEWHSIHRPAGAPASRKTHALAADSAGSIAWLAAADAGGVWIGRLEREDEIPTLGAPRMLRIE